MARPLRIEYPDAVYHVSNYALKKRRAFPSDNYFAAFLAALADSCARLNVTVHAYCLLNDQYHLIIRTPEANLSRFMRQVDGLYTQQYHHMKRTGGSLFLGRYKAVLIQAEKYLLPLTRYIHSHVKSSQLKSYKWSSYPLYKSNGKLPTWLDRNDALKQLKTNPVKRAQAYAKYVADGVDADMLRFYGKKSLSSIMGDVQFKNRVRNHASATTVRGVSRGSNAKWRPTCKKIISAVAKQFKVSESSIFNAARGPGSKNVPRWVAMYLCQELSAESLEAISKLFKLKRYGTVSTTVGKLKKEFTEDKKLLAVTQKLVRHLSKGK
jgi:putative transposase